MVEERKQRRCLGTLYHSQARLNADKLPVRPLIGPILRSTCSDGTTHEKGQAENIDLPSYRARLSIDHRITEAFQ
jgi:hypothetical protein